MKNIDLCRSGTRTRYGEAFPGAVLQVTANNLDLAQGELIAKALGS